MLNKYESFQEGKLQMINIDIEKCIGCSLCVKDCQCSDIKIKDGIALPLNKSCLNCGHCVAVCPQNAVTIDVYNMSEVKVYNSKEFVIEPDKLLNSIKFRRSIRQFNNTHVEAEKIKTIIEAGRFAPTGGNRQPLSYIVVQEKMIELTSKTIEVLYDNACKYEPDDNDPTSMESQRYSTMWKFMHRQFKRGKDKLFFNAPNMIIVLSDKNLSVSPIVDGALAASNMEMMANSLKLGACFNGFFTFASESEIIRNYLNIPDNKKVVTSLLIGYTDIKYLRTVPRKKPEIQWM